MTSPAIVREALERVSTVLTQVDYPNGHFITSDNLAVGDVQTLARAALAALDATPGEGERAPLIVLEHISFLRDKAARLRRRRYFNAPDLTARYAKQADGYEALADAIATLRPLPAAPLSGSVVK